MLHRERRTSSRSSSSSGFSRRESLFDLLFLLRRSSHRHKAQVENDIYYAQSCKGCQNMG
ncbi:hypothetical protein T02_9418 [Trichinella nativa]|uniref:Uncharacterized protein n=1 Tax=Trichinella nativa TaxID=6335 RepID=A0A0V1KR64_9BILA|nr:hypothetical protein T06_12132 [Trichinella sp. T6]KRZ49770.1 hypothetical protein T02_9418 [Trichinella nativa]KRZ83254.1 hypothetical protein T08_9632 [Trichinella sp. T8]